MGVSCTKEMSINVVGTAPSLYWKFDEVGNVTRVDSVIASPLIVFAGTVPSVPGILNNAANFPATSGLLGDGTLIINQGFTAGFSLSMWIKIVAPSVVTQNAGGQNFGNPAFVEGITWAFGAGIPSALRIRWFSPDFTTTDLTLSIPDNNWHFITTTLSANLQQITASIDANAPVTANLGTAFVATTTMGHSFGSGGAPLSFDWDEYGVFFNKVFSAADRTALFGGGTPPSYPFGIP